MIDEFSFKGRGCWSAWGPGEFFGFAKQGETVCAVIRNENDDSVHMLDIFRGDLRLNEAGAHPPIEMVTVTTYKDTDLYLNVRDFEQSDGWVTIVYVDLDGDICEKKYRADIITFIDIVYKTPKEDTNETL